MKTISGKVISTKMQNTAVIEVTRFTAHPMYHKRVRHTKKFHADNTIGAKTGQTVKLAETKPQSRTKFWKIIEITKEHAAA